MEPDRGTPDEAFFSGAGSLASSPEVVLKTYIDSCAGLNELRPDQFRPPPSIAPPTIPELVLLAEVKTIARGIWPSVPAG
jgi:hypothetical protein